MSGARADLAAGSWHGPPPREICVMMLSAIGDAVHVLPVANALRRAWPDTRLTWVVQPGPHALVRGHAAIDEFIVFHRRRGLGAWAAFADFARTVRERRFDLLLGLQVYFKAGVLIALVPAEVKLGFDRARARDLQWLVTNARIPPHPPQHVQDQYFEFLRFLGIDPEPVTWDLRLGEAEREAQAAFFGALGGPAMAVVVGTSHPGKNWTAEGYARVIEEAERLHGLRAVLVGGPSPAERALADRVLARTSARVVDALGDDLRKLVWIVEGSALTLTPDTGPLHISRALGTPVVGLFGPTDPARSGPYRAYGELVVDGRAGHVANAGPAGRAHPDAMRRITADMVLRKVALALQRYGS